MKQSMLEVLFEEQVRTARLPKPERNHRFLADRKYELDFAWIGPKIALEIEGAVWSGGAHGRGSGIVRDIEKGNLAAQEGWVLFRATGDMVNDGTAIAMLVRALADLPVRSCEECGQVFDVRDKRMRFCTARCRQKKWLAEHPQGGSK